MLKDIILIVTFLTISLYGFSQDYSIVEREGGKFYSHKVEAGHTLYAIAVLYDSDEEIIRAYNDVLLTEGLKVGQTIFIPVSPEFKPGVVKNPIRIEDGFLVHKVLKRETLFSICQLYTVDVNDVLELNPSANSGLKKGQELKIPVNDVNTDISVAPPVNFDLPKWKTHVVLPGETLYGISKKYSVAIKDILEINDGLPEGLKANQVVNIPIELEDETEPLAESPPAHEILKSWKRKRDNPFKDTYDVAVALPFYISKLDSSDFTLKERKIQNVALSFYRGAYLAALKLEEEGLSMNFHVMDITSDRKKTKLLASDEKMHTMDLFIGPFQKEPLVKVIEIAEGSGAHVVCPTPQSGKLLLSHPNVSKVTPSGSTMMGEMAEYIASLKDSPNVILVKTKWVKDKRNISVFEQAYYNSLGDSTLMLKRKLKVINVDDLSAASLKASLSENKRNILIMPTEEKISLGKLVNVLPFIRTNYDLDIILTDKWIDNDYIDSKTRNQFNIHIPTNFSRNYNAKEVKKFAILYNSEFDDVINEYSVLGHDIMLFYGRGLQEFGADFPHYFGEISTEGLLDYIFDFEAVGPDSGYENHGTHLMHFDEFEFKPVERGL